MTVEINFSFINVSDSQEALRAVLRPFEEENRVQVNLIEMDWANAWASLSKYALDRRGADISEIGSTWLSSLVDMNALHPFSLPEGVEGGALGSFLPQVWDGVLFNKYFYAMPWFCDVRLLYYRRDWLEKVNLSPDHAFSSLDSLCHTLETLRQAGFPNVWAVPTRRDAQNVHLISSWVWGFGGDFCSPDGKKLVLDQPKATQGLSRYFEMTRFMRDYAPDISDAHLQEMFLQGQLAVFPSGLWLAMRGIESLAPQLAEKWGIAPMPGVPFVGGTHLVMWKHSTKRDIAEALLAHLASAPVQARLYPHRLLLPSNRALLESHRGDNPVFDAGFQALKTGRRLPAQPLWAKVEDRLIAELNGIWADILDIPIGEIQDGTIQEIVDTRIRLLVRRLNQVLAS